MHILIAGAEEKMQNYIAAAESVGFDTTSTLELPSLEELKDYDGLLLPGGGDLDPALYGQEVEENGAAWIHPELDSAQRAILDTFVKAGKPILGICRGHQLINVYFGGTLIQDLGEKNAVHRYTGSDKVHHSTAEEGSWIASLYGTSLYTNSAHHQAVDRIADGFRAIQMSDDGVIEAIINDSLPILSIQWHPERMCCALKRDDTIDGSKVFKAFYELCEKMKK